VRGLLAARERSHAVAVAFYAKPISIIFDLVEPLGAGRHDPADSGNAELELRHRSKIVSRSGFGSRTDDDNRKIR
jgi:hypothetical protein